MQNRDDAAFELELENGDRIVSGVTATYLYKLSALLSTFEYELLDIECRVSILQQLMDFASETSEIRELITERMNKINELRREVIHESSITVISSKQTAMLQQDIREDLDADMEEKPIDDEATDSENEGGGNNSSNMGVNAKTSTSWSAEELVALQEGVSIYGSSGFWVDIKNHAGDRLTNRSPLNLMEKYHSIERLKALNETPGLIGGATERERRDSVAIEPPTAKIDSPSAMDEDAPMANESNEISGVAEGDAKRGKSTDMPANFAAPSNWTVVQRTSGTGKKLGKKYIDPASGKSFRTLPDVYRYLLQTGGVSEEYLVPMKERAALESSNLDRNSLHAQARANLASIELPLAANSVKVLNLGRVDLREKYHDKIYIFPVGFKSTRPYFSTVDPTCSTIYTTEILDGGDSGPLFRLTSAADPDFVIEKSSATAVWVEVLTRVSEKKRGDTANKRKMACSGPEYLGLKHPAVVDAIEGLENADKCMGYEFRLMRQANNEKAGTNPGQIRGAFLNSGVFNAMQDDLATTIDSLSSPSVTDPEIYNPSAFGYAFSLKTDVASIYSPNYITFDSSLVHPGFFGEVTPTRFAGGDMLPCTYCGLVLTEEDLIVKIPFGAMVCLCMNELTFMYIK